MNSFLSRQYPNFILWAPFIMAFGMALYFAIPTEPVIVAPYMMSMLCTASLFMVYRRRASVPMLFTLILSAALLFAFGFFYAAGFSRNLSTPTISRDMRIATATGTVSGIDYTAGRTRIFMNNSTINSPYGNTQQNNMNIRISMPGDLPPPKIGDRINMDATLFRPMPADVPGGFDMAEWAYFNGISATGYSNGFEITDATHNENSVAKLRDNIYQKIASHDNARATALAGSLILGYKRALPETDSVAAKAAGIAHVFSISGFHMTLVGGWIFAIFYFLARMFPNIARRIPVRNFAIVPTGIALCFYLVVSGAGVATQRALVMAIIGFLALAFSRNLFSMCSAVLVFGGLLLLDPHHVTQAGFQLSFSAVFGILWLFRDRKFEHRTRWQKIGNGLKTVALIDIIATAFTAPFVAYHFYNIPVYSLLGNLLCLPLFSLAILPLTLVGTVTAMFGFFLPLDLAAHVYEIVLGITNWIAGLPGAVFQTPAIPGSALALMVFGLLSFIFIINGKHRLNIIFAGIFAVFSLVMVALWQRPIFYATHDRELVAFMKDDGTLQFNKSRSGNHKMAFGAWENFNWTSVPESRKPIRKGFAGEKYSVICENRVCIYTTPKWKLAYIQQFVPLANSIKSLCMPGNMDFIVTYWDLAAPDCAARILSGGFVIYKNGNVKHIPANRVWHK
ncbi:MAG: ComEC family competence protein [Alphaproteobacteria bacterium]|nr:ComEC family competence protein [Alphaproteobacteria bacterium]